MKPLDLLQVTNLMKDREFEINGIQKNNELIQEIHPVLGFSYLTFHSCRMREVTEQIQQLSLESEQNKKNSIEDQYYFSPTMTSLMILLKEFNIYFPKEIFKQLQIKL